MKNVEEKERDDNEEEMKNTNHIYFWNRFYFKKQYETLDTPFKSFIGCEGIKWRKNWTKKNLQHFLFQVLRQ